MSKDPSFNLELEQAQIELQIEEMKLQKKRYSVRKLQLEDELKKLEQNQLDADKHIVSLEAKLADIKVAISNEKKEA